MAKNERLDSKVKFESRMDFSEHIQINGYYNGELITIHGKTRRKKKIKKEIARQFGLVY